MFFIKTSDHSRVSISFLRIFIIYLLFFFVEASYFLKYLSHTFDREEKKEGGGERKHLMTIRKEIQYILKNIKANRISVVCCVRSSCSHECTQIKSNAFLVFGAYWITYRTVLYGLHRFTQFPHPSTFLFIVVNTFLKLLSTALATFLSSSEKQQKNFDLKMKKKRKENRERTNGKRNRSNYCFVVA